jgi:tRNA threonylcarbamoyladenosine biosynthesis protein TsaE
MWRQVVSQSTGDTQALGEQLGGLLEAGDIVCLYGELGSGKTVLSKGIAKGLGVADEHTVRSPSFVLIHRYQGRVPMYHADLYRLDSPTEIADIGLREFLAGDGARYRQRFERWLALPRARGETYDPRGEGVERMSP